MLSTKPKPVFIPVPGFHGPTSRSGPVLKTLVKPSVSEAAKRVEVTLPRKIRVDLQESKAKTPNPPKGKLHERPAWVCHFCGKSRHIRPNCFKLQAAKRANKPKVPMPQAQDPMVLIGELVKALNLYSNPGVAHHFDMNITPMLELHLKRFGCKMLNLIESF